MSAVPGQHPCIVQRDRSGKPMGKPWQTAQVEIVAVQVMQLQDVRNVSRGAQYVPRSWVIEVLTPVKAVDRDCRGADATHHLRNPTSTADPAQGARRKAGGSIPGA